MKTTLFFLLLSAHFALAQSTGFTLFDNRTDPTLVVGAAESEAVRLAVYDLAGDILTVSGQKAVLDTSVGTGKGQIIVQTKASAVPFEQYQLRTENGNLYIIGNDERATIFGVYHFAEHFLGIDPMYFWSDKQPPKQSRLSWPSVAFTSEKPQFRYRGWFINDEDLLTEWHENSGRRNIDYPYYTQVVSPDVMEKICETALRMRFNLIIPASFIDIKNPAEAALVDVAAKRGLFLSMHHIEPMGVSAFTYFNYWQAKTGEKPLFSYFSNREKVEEVWRAYADAWATYPNVIWQIGLRGIGDRPMWLADPNTPQSDADRGRLISDAMRFQMDYIRKIDPRPNPPVTTTLWAEGSVLNQQGHLAIPGGVTIVFADNSPGWRWQTDFFETSRQPRNTYGIYYHHQLWSSGPHLAQIVPPAQTQKVIGQAVEKGDTTYCIMNVSNIREFQFGIAASAAMLWFADFSTDAFKAAWFRMYYGENAKRVATVYDAYFNSFALDETGTTLALMDGQSRGAGLGLLNDLKKQLTDPTGYAAAQKARQQQSAERKWASTALRDMNPGFANRDAQLMAVRQQKAGFLRADSLATLTLPVLRDEQKAFFRTNILSPITIMLGLETWLEHVLLAKQAADVGHTDQVARQLQRAVQSLETVKRGQAMNTQTEKWRHWYRGDKKMNIDAMRRTTEEMLTSARTMNQK